jgi:hypothetical protein
VGPFRLSHKRQKVSSPFPIVTALLIGQAVRGLETMHTVLEGIAGTLILLALACHQLLVCALLPIDETVSLVLEFDYGTSASVC